MGNMPILLNTDQVAQRLGVSKGTAYNNIKELNREIQESGCKVIQAACAVTSWKRPSSAPEELLAMIVKQAKSGTWFTQFRCKDKKGNEVHKCKRGYATEAEAKAWEKDFIATQGCTMEITFEEFFGCTARTCCPICASTREPARRTWSSRSR